MIRKMMFPTDFSLAAEKIFNCIPSFKVLGMKEALLVHVVDERYDAAVLERAKLAQYELEKYKDQFKDEGIKVKVIVKTGVPSVEINKLAEKEKVSLVVLTSHGKSMIEKMLLGSVTEKVIFNCTRPVLLERVAVFENYKQKTCSELICKNTFKHVLFPTDWSECANDVLKSVRKFKKFGTKEITVMHVMDERNLKYHTKEKIAEFKKIDQDKLDKVAKDLKKRGFKVNTLLTKGSPFKEIKRAARKSEITLITMGVHGKGFVKEILLGSTTERVAKFAFKPVLLLSHNEY